jgi:hypothetical protein
MIITLKKRYIRPSIIPEGFWLVEGEYDYLGFHNWPFHTVPDIEFSRLWFDMDQTYSEVQKLARSLEIKPQSSINPIWGWFGMGKSHILMHLAGKWQDDASIIVPVYMEFPVETSSFLHLYSGFAKAFLSSHRRLLVKMSEYCMNEFGLESFQSKICPQLRDFAMAMRLLAYGESVDTVEQWLTGSNVHLRSLRNVGLSSRIDDDNRAIFALASLAALVRHYPKKRKLVWLLDETQKILNIRPKQRSTIQAGMQSLFNQCPIGLSIVPAYSGRQPDKIAQILSSALLSRVGTSRRVSITPLTVNDAKLFVEQLFDAFRTEDYSGDKFSPFTEAAIDHVIETIEQSRWFMKPRNVMKLLESIIEDHELKIASGDIKAIDIEHSEMTIKRIRESSEMVSALTKIE